MRSVSRFRREARKLYQGLRRKGKAGKELERIAESKNSASTLAKIVIKMCKNCRNMGLGWELRKECSVFSFQRCVSRTGRACEGEQRGRIDHWGRRQGIDFAGSPLLTLRVRPCWKPDASARKCFAETDDRPPLLTLRVSKRKTLARPLPRGGEG